MQIFVEFFSEILEVSVDAFRTMLRHHFGPSCGIVCLRIQHDIMDVSCHSHVVDRDLLATYELEVRLLFKNIIKFLEVFGGMQGEQCLHGLFFCAFRSVPNCVIKELVLKIFLEILLECLAPVDEQGILGLEIVHVAQVVEYGVSLHQSAAICQLEHWELAIFEQALCLQVVELLAGQIIITPDILETYASLVQRHAYWLSERIAVKVVQLDLALWLGRFAFWYGLLGLLYFFGGLLHGSLLFLLVGLVFSLGGIGLCHFE